MTEVAHCISGLDQRSSEMTDALSIGYRVAPVKFAFQSLYDTPCPCLADTSCPETPFFLRPHFPLHNMTMTA